jgi:hypothetical protein
LLIGTALPKNFETILNLTNFNSPKFNFSLSSTIDILLNPAKKVVTAAETETKIAELKSVFGRMNKNFFVTFHHSLVCNSSLF